ncbi:MAG: CNNM domain-containing protein [Planctomycetota bacterium]|nr:CNNM domain-containing protein [Planctomycetota bacterium]MDA1106306.1 CNNM domain-containing protein [Planctomycetota bacterium]
MGLLSGLETGFYTVSRVRLAVRLARGDRRARILANELRNTTGALIALLLLINLAGFVQAWGLASWLDSIGVEQGQLALINFLILAPLVYVLGDLLPKDLFRVHAEAWTYPLAATVRAVRVGCGCLGIVWVIGRMVGAVIRLAGRRHAEVRFTSREEVARAVQEGEGAGLLHREDIEVADRVMRLRSETIEGCVVPWDRVSAVPLDAAPSRRAELLGVLPFTRVPVVGESGSVVGVLSSLDASLSPHASTESLMVQPVVVAPDTPVASVLRLMRDNRTQTVIVGSLDRPRGIATLKDVARPIVGDAAWLGT